MTRWGMVIDLARCIGCNACTLACKMEHGTPPDVYYTRVYTEEIGSYPDVRTLYVPALCNHCEDAPCVSVCPTGASYTRDDGVVLIDENKCIGCRYCMVACPYNERFYLREGSLDGGYHGERSPFEDTKWQWFTEGTVVKCNFCVHRVDEGLDPACVVTCLTEARVFGDLDDPESKVSTLIREHEDQLQADAGVSVYYLEGKPELTKRGEERSVSDVVPV